MLRKAILCTYLTQGAVVGIILAVLHSHSLLGNGYCSLDALSNSHDILESARHSYTWLQNDI